MKIITLVDRNEDFIPMQYKSIQKHIKEPYEYIVFNNGKTKEQKNIIRELCKGLSVECKDIYVNYTSDPSTIVADSLNYMYEKYLKQLSEPVICIDSDMFLIRDINFLEMFKDNDLIFVPAYRGSKFEVCYMWSGFFGINFETVKHTVDFGLGIVENIRTDVMGKSYYLLKENYRVKYIEYYCLANADENNIYTNKNGNCRVSYEGDKIKIEDTHMTDGRLYPYETPSDTYYIDMKKVYEDMYSTMKKYNFPKPYNIDFIIIDGKFSVVHFKSANWSPDYTKEYVENKKVALKNLFGLENKK